MRFLDEQLLPAKYRWHFLDYLDEVVPEVRDSVASLASDYYLFVEESVDEGALLHFLIEKTRHESLISEAVSDQNWELIDYLGYEGRVDEDILDQVWLLTTSDNSRSARFLILFNELINDFCLTTRTDWLSKDLLRFLIQVCRYGPECIKSIATSSNGSWSPKICEEFTFQRPGWAIEMPWGDFETHLRETFEWALRSYKEETLSALRNAGAKHKTKNLDYSRVKWLVHWTVKRTSKKEILEMIRKERPSTMTEDTLNEYFRELEHKFDLPYRRLKRGKSPG